MSEENDCHTSQASPKEGNDDSGARRDSLREANRTHCKQTRERKKRREQLLHEVRTHTSGGMGWGGMGCAHLSLSLVCFCFGESDFALDHNLFSFFVSATTCTRTCIICQRHPIDPCTIVVLYCTEYKKVPVVHYNLDMTLCLLLVVWFGLRTQNTEHDDD